jgi:hypothetical protein
MPVTASDTSPLQTIFTCFAAPLTSPQVDVARQQLQPTAAAQPPNYRGVHTTSSDQLRVTVAGRALTKSDIGPPGRSMFRGTQWPSAATLGGKAPSPVQQFEDPRVVASVSSKRLASYRGVYMANGSYAGRAALCLALCACRFPTDRPEAPFARDEANGGARAGSGPMATPQTDAGQRSDTPVPPATATRSAAGSVAVGSAGHAAAPGPTPATPSAGSTSTVADTDAGFSDSTACAAELSACINRDPQASSACISTFMEQCGTPLPDAGLPQAPSPACSMQTANCIAQNPSDPQMCFEMEKSCKL